MKSKATAVITAMTDDERPFIKNCIQSVVYDKGIGQVVLCVSDDNDWLESELSGLVENPVLEIYKIPLCNAGVARNFGIRLAKFPWIALCDGDDVWCSGKTALQIDLAEREQANFVGSDHYLTDEEGNIKACALAKYMPMTSSWIIKTSTLLNHPFDENLKRGHDGEWWLRTHSHIIKVRCPERLLKYRVRSNSLSSNQPSKKKKAMVVKFASIPVMDMFIYTATYFLWLLSRNKKYIWKEKSWGKKPVLMDNSLHTSLT